VEISKTEQIRDVNDEDDETPAPSTTSKGGNIQAENIRSEFLTCVKDLAEARSLRAKQGQT
jgi:hypothetical protein